MIASKISSFQYLLWFYRLFEATRSNRHRKDILKIISHNLLFFRLKKKARNMLQFTTVMQDFSIDQPYLDALKCLSPLLLYIEEKSSYPTFHLKVHRTRRNVLFLECLQFDRTGQKDESRSEKQRRIRCCCCCCHGTVIALRIDSLFHEAPRCTVEVTAPGCSWVSSWRTEAATGSPILLPLASRSYHSFSFSPRIPFLSATSSFSL